MVFPCIVLPVPPAFTHVLARHRVLGSCHGWSETTPLAVKPAFRRVRSCGNQTSHHRLDPLGWFVAMSLICPSALVTRPDRDIHPNVIPNR